jgi:signal transduction histidine kinase
VHHEATRLEQFSDDIAHEIKNKLFSIGSSLDVALLPEHRDRGIEKARKMISELSSIVDALLFFARHEEIELKMMDIGKLIEESSSIEDSRIRLQIEK